MDYKKIIKSRKLRLKILQLLAFVPDELMIKLQYRMKTGRKLDLKNPKRFTEKLQWYKLYYKNPLMIKCVDKYDVREYVKSKGLGEILIPCFGVYDSEKEINWEELPEQFVLKDTLGGGGNSVIIVNEKTSADIDGLRQSCRNWIAEKAHVKSGGREWPYYFGKNHRIIIEKFIDHDSAEEGLIDYKFFCFDGKVEYLYAIADREIGKDARFGIYDKDFNLLNVYRLDERPLERNLTKPVNFERLTQVAEILSSEFPEVRIDLYSTQGEVIFGEMTFYDGSGYMTFEPDEFDYLLGEKFNI